MLNRSIICKVANNLRKGGYTLSQAFRMAWKLAKGKASVKVAGVTKERRQEAIEHLSRYNPETVSFILNRESEISMTATQLQYMQVWAAARLTKWAIFPLLWRVY